MTALVLKLPFPPTINHYYERNGHRIFLGKAGTLFRQQVAESCCHLVNEPITGRVLVKVTLHNKTGRSYDIDNRCKALLDSLTHAAVWNDDSQVDQLFIQRGRPINGGLCVVEISQINNLIL